MGKINRSLVKRRHKSCTVALAKHMSTQTSEEDCLPIYTTHKNHIRNPLFKKPIKKLGNRKVETQKLMQTVFVKPKYESTPLRKTENHQNSFSDCEILVENVTPIRGKCKNYKSHHVESNSSRELMNRMCKSDSKNPSRLFLSSSLTAKDMLSLDETLFKSLDIESVEEKLTSNAKETSLQSNSLCHSKMASNRSSKPFTASSKVRSVESYSTVSVGNEISSKTNKGMLQMPASPPVTKRKGEIMHSQVAGNSITVTADVHWDGIESIENDNWTNDSLMNRVLNSSRYNHATVTAKNMSNTTSYYKRLGHNVNENLPLNKKQKNHDDLTFKRNEICYNIIENVSEKKKETTQNASFYKSSVSDISVKRWNMSQKHVKEINGAGKGTLKTKPSSVKVGCRRNMNFDEDNSVDVGYFSKLSEGGEVCKMVSTNAQKTVTIGLLTSDVIMHSPADAINLFKFGPFFGLPSYVKTLFEKHKGIYNLYEWQKECLSLPAVNEKKNLVYALPTSGGKTLVAEILLLRELLCYKKDALFILPYVAIVQEKVNSLSPFAIDLGFYVEEYAAGKGQYPPRKRRSKQSVYVATIEKAHSLINSMMESKRLSEIGLVVVDELHLLGEGDRGASMECLLAKLLFCSENIHIVGMSATIGNLEEVAKFLHAEIYLNNFRPVELKEYVKCEDTLWAVNGVQEELLTEVRKIDPPYTSNMNKLDPDKVCGLVLEVVPEYSCLVFCPTKNNCENLASLFVNIMPKELVEYRKEERKALSQALLTGGRGTVCPILQKSVAYGVAYHHSGLTGDERRMLEEAYRAGTLCCICCTSTLAAGVNLPAKRVILRAPFVAGNFISLSQYKQMVGRAGRAGLDASGESILICRPCDMQQVNALLKSRMDNTCSQLHVSISRGLQSLVLSSVGLGIANCRRDLHNMVACTLLHAQSARLKVQSNQLVDTTIKDLFKLGALKCDSTASSSNAGNHKNISYVREQSYFSLNITAPADQCTGNVESGSKRLKKHIAIGRDTCLTIKRLGRASIKGPIDLCRATELCRDLVQAQRSMVLSSYLHLLYLVTPYDMMDQIKPDPSVYFNVYNRMNAKDMQTAHVLGINHGCMLKIMRGSKAFNISERVVHRFYITLILNDLWNQCGVWEVAKKYNIPRGTVQTLMTSAASFASCVMHFCEELSEFWAFKELLGGFAQRLSHCCSADLVQLMELPAVKTGRARQLYNAGYKTLLDVANASADALVSIDYMSRKVANEIIAAAKLLLLSKAENLREEAEMLEGVLRKSSTD